MQNKFNIFFNQWNGKFLEAYDPSNLNQCYDLITEWCNFLGIKPPMTMYAYQIFGQLPDVYNSITNTPTGIPQVGDIIVWDKKFNGTAGHTGVATGKGDTKTFECFEQNDPLGTPCHLKTYNYNHVIGWLHPKKENNLDTQKIIDELRKARDDNWQLYQTALETNKRLVEQNSQLERERDEYKEDLRQEQIKSQSLREALDKQTEADADTGAELLDAQHKVEEYRKDLMRICVELGIDTNSDITLILGQLQTLQAPSDETTKEYLKLAKALEDFFYKRKVSAKGIWKKIKDFILRRG